MKSKDLEMILDSLDNIGVYVVREDNHQILYFNKRTAQVAPGVKLGMVCGDAWGGSCARCPLIGIDGKKTNNTFQPLGPGGKPTDISAARVLWDDEIPAYVIRFQPHVETLNFTFEKVVKGNLTTDECEAVKMLPAERKFLPEEGFTLRMALDSFMQNGYLYAEDKERFRTFSNFENLSKELHSGKKNVICCYRRNTPQGPRWNTMEVVPDFDYSDDNQSIMIYVKDVEDVYKEGLKHEALNIKTEAILKTLGRENFAIYSIDLEAGMMDCVAMDEKDKELFNSTDNVWDEVVEKLAEYRYHADYKELFRSTFSLEALRKTLNKKKRKIEMLLERLVGGQYRYVNASAYFHTDVNGKKHVICAFQDADERVRRELAHVREERKMAAIICSRYSTMTTVDLKTGECERVTFDKPLEEGGMKKGPYEPFVEWALNSIIYPEDREIYRSHLSIDNLRKKAEMSNDFNDEIIQYRIKNGESLHWVEHHICYIRQGDSVIVSFLGRDITEAKAREEAEKRIAREKVYIINTLSEMFCSTVYVYLDSGKMSSIVQRDIVKAVIMDDTMYQSALEKYVNKIVYPDDRKAFLSVFSINAQREGFRTKSSATLEFREYGDGPSQIRWMRATAIVSETEGNLAKTALYIAQDITAAKAEESRERKALQDAYDSAKLANEAKSQFLSKMSHDIRTPMNAIIGMTAIAGVHIDERDRVVDCLGKISVSSKHLLALINEVLDISRIESGKMVLTEEEFELSKLFDDLMAIILPATRAKQQTLNVKINVINHENVISDMLRLQQVFSNILSNAVKYTDEGGKIDVELNELSSKTPGYGKYQFIFRDNGIGMSEEFQKHIFEPFAREKSQRIETTEGTGLGMMIVNSIVQMMNGTITVNSVLGKGSEFIVTLPLKLAGAESGGTHEFDDLNVLVVDDDKDACESTCVILTDIGMHGEWVLSGEEAVERVVGAHKKDDDFFAVVIDWKMPGMDGVETTRRIRKEVGNDVPIIILSAYDWSEIEKEAREAGVDGFISKPLFKSKLVYLFKQFLSRNVEHDEAQALTNPLENCHYPGRRLLLAEDNELNREVASTLLGMTEAVVECAENGKIAVQMFEEKGAGYYDMILMDIRMPIMDGYEATEKIRSLDREDAKTIPIIAMTADAFRSDAQNCKKYGMNGHIPKPLDLAEVAKVLNKWFS